MPKSAIESRLPHRDIDDQRMSVPLRTMLMGFLASIVISIVISLHRSRRLQARRLRRQHRHLMASPWDGEPQVPQARSGGGANVRR